MQIWLEKQLTLKLCRQLLGDEEYKAAKEVAKRALEAAVPSLREDGRYTAGWLKE